MSSLKEYFILAVPTIIYVIIITAALIPLQIIYKRNKLNKKRSNYEF